MKKSHITEEQILDKEQKQETYPFIATHPLALFRATLEAFKVNPILKTRLLKRGTYVRILDVGCGTGNALLIMTATTDS